MPGEENLQGTAATPFYQWSAAGLAGVWAEQNNREDIYAAFRRKETFATSGPRLKVRLFAGYGYASDIFERDDFARAAYRGGVPMGGDLARDGKKAPTFLAEAMKDPDSAGLERLQLIRQRDKLLFGRDAAAENVRVVVLRPRDERETVLFRRPVLASRTHRVTVRVRIADFHRAINDEQ